MRKAALRGCFSHYLLQALVPVCYTLAYMQFAIDLALSLIYFALFLLLCAWSWRFWIMYIGQKSLMGLEWIMLEIKLPREIMKSPFAAEVALSSLLQGGGVGTNWHRLYKGNLPNFGSVEIASIEGILHFYVRIQKKFKSLVEANFYAQYPGIEIIETEDYTRLIRYHHLTHDVSMWGARYKLTENWKLWDKETGDRKKNPKDPSKPYEMPADFFPIKTYVDYELNKNPKEEEKIDPITPMLEFMGSIGKGEHFWFQIVMTDEGNFNGKKFPTVYVNEVDHEHVTLKDMAKTFKEELRITGFNPKGTSAKDQYGGSVQRAGKDEDGNPIMIDVTYKEHTPQTKKEQDLTSDDKEQIEAINRKMSKPMALSVVRMVYIAEKGSFNPQNIQNILSWPKPFKGANGFAPERTTDPYNYPWQNWQGRRVPWRTEEMFEEYVERAGFFPHITKREWLDRWEDTVFWSSSMSARRLFRLLYEGFFHPFSHPKLEDVISLNLEEIATMWHLPGTVVTTPTLPRIDSNKGVAPVNLPQ